MMACQSARAASYLSDVGLSKTRLTGLNQGLRASRNGAYEGGLIVTHVRRLTHTYHHMISHGWGTLEQPN